MLSRVADNLFWIARSVERADNIARLIDTARRMITLPNVAGKPLTNEWSSILIAAGASTTFQGDLEHATREEAIEHLVADPSNPSSIYNCFRNARENARAIRFGLTTEVWNSLNSSWNELPNQIAALRHRPAYLAEFVDWVKICQSQFRGGVEGSLVRDDSLEFMRLGSHIERADATARILDVKYHVLLPSLGEIGGSLDHYQWLSLLQAVGVQRAYHFVTKSDVTRKGVAAFLIKNKVNPRSMAYCISSAIRSLETLETIYEQSPSCLELARTMHDDLKVVSIDDVLNNGLHEYLTWFIQSIASLSGEIAESFAFAPPVSPDLENEPNMSQVQG
ncbi:MAG: hypothetical protein CMK09_13685 [Ponticaulis sp.]|nr:hypothetical protein [Ponticaulis sp.]|tara:strand:+ start:32558 stop:33562 length:1005 start_codon:yes stop_codon:yes gene_type:complete